MKQQIEPQFPEKHPADMSLDSLAKYLREPYWWYSISNIINIIFPIDTSDYVDHLNDEHRMQDKVDRRGHGRHTHESDIKRWAKAMNFG